MTGVSACTGRQRAGVLAMMAALCCRNAGAQTPPMAPDVTERRVAPPGMADHEGRVVIIPMRYGVRLHTVIVIPKQAGGARMLLTRAP